MKIGLYHDGREVSYDEANESFAIGDAPISAEQLQTYDAAGQVAWSSAETRQWFHSTRTPAPAQPVGMSTTQPTATKPWFAKRWVWIAGAVVLLIAVAGSLSDAPNRSERTEGAPSNPAASEPAAEPDEPAEPEIEPIPLTVSAPNETESETAELTGETVAGAAVLVNGSSATLDADGRFTHTCSLQKGHNTFEVTCSMDGYEGSQRTVSISRLAFEAITARDFELVVKNPDGYIGDTYVIWGEVTQFDAATGLDTFRADTGAERSEIEYGWMTDYDENTMLVGDQEALANVVEGDCFEAKVTVLGSYSYDTQIGGATTVPMFEVYSIEVYDSIED